MSRIPVATIGDYTVTFEALTEDVDARTHFVKECGWTQKQFDRIRHYPFFCAHVAIWKDGEQVADQFLGCCSYKTERDFYTTYRADYFADMVCECLGDIGESALAGQWRQSVAQ